MLHDSLTDLQVSVRNELTTLLCSTSVPPFKPPFPFFHRGHVVVHPLLHVLSLLSVLRAQAVVLRALTAAQSFVSSYRETQVWKNSYTFALVFQHVWLISSPSDLALSLALLTKFSIFLKTLSRVWLLTSRKQLVLRIDLRIKRMTLFVCTVARPSASDSFVYQW